MHFLNNELVDGFIELQGGVVFTESGSVQRLFYSEIEKKETYIIQELTHQKVL